MRQSEKEFYLKDLLSVQELNDGDYRILGHGRQNRIIMIQMSIAITHINEEDEFHASGKLMSS